MRRAALIVAVLLLAAGAAGLAWYLTRPPVPAPTAGAWTAAVTTIAGRGEPGVRDGRGPLAHFSDPFAVAVAADGRVVIADSGDSNSIRAFDSDRVTTIAGGSGEGHADGAAAAARFHTPSGVAIAPDGDVYVADTGNHRIRRITRDGRVTTLAGTGTPGLKDGRAAAAEFNGPIGIAVLESAAVPARPRFRVPSWFRRRHDGTDTSPRTPVTIVVADTYNDAIRVVDADGTVTTLAGGSGPGCRDGTGSSAQFDTPSGVAVLPDGTLLVADTGNGVVRRVGRRGDVTTVTLLPVDVNADVSLFRPVGMAASHDGTFYVTDRRGRILQVLPDGRARVLAGAVGGFADGPGPLARFHNPTGIAVDAEGALIVADAGNYLLRRLAPAGLYTPDPPRSPLAPAPGVPSGLLVLPLLPWPVDPQFEWQELAGNMGEARGNLTDARERFHAGIDVRAGEGAVVRAVASGKVDAPLASLGFDGLSESLSIGPFTYVHVRVGRERKGEPLDEARAQIVRDQGGTPVRVRVLRGTRFQLGDAIGTVNRFNHVHLNVGSPGREVNPLLLPLAGFQDTVPPRLERNGIVLLNEAGLPVPKTGRRPVISGRVRIVVDAWDQVDGNLPRRRLGVFRLGYQVLYPDRTPVPGFASPRITIDFTELPQDPRAPALVYAAGSGIPVYGTRRTRFLYIVTNTVRDGIAEEGSWDTATLEPGRYILRIYAADTKGNVAVDGRDLAVMVQR